MTRKKQLKPIHKDRRGSIIKVLEGKITSVLLIPSKKGAVRANHYHKKDTHYVYMVSGKMRYTTKSMRDDDARKRSQVLKAGDLIFTPPMLAHAMEFLEDSVFLALTTKSRTKRAYENDTVRVELV